ncbi:unnamed protein product [Phytophthora fragariaefolia]|uniref:Unnamed protein product n=1 Tax=Phytophthora fragariaefolia TaxID=1490495 RepID=A0A9W6XIU1_9STRA|nr:unnamed protein product [Phytophthora fragariaefolia]
MEVGGVHDHLVHNVDDVPVHVQNICTSAQHSTNVAELVRIRWKLPKYTVPHCAGTESSNKYNTLVAVRAPPAQLLNRVMSPNKNWATMDSTTKKADVEWNKDGRPINWNGRDWPLYKRAMMRYLACYEVKENE